MIYDFGYGILLAAKVSLVFGFIYIFIPSHFIKFREEDSPLDKVFISLIYSNLITIIIVYLLAFARLYETISLLFCYFIVYIGFAWFKGKSPAAIADAIGMKIVINLLDMSESPGGFTGEIVKSLRSWVDKTRNNARQAVRSVYSNPLAFPLAVCIFIAALVMRFSHSITHAYFCSADAYVHLVWSKYLGANQIFKDGIYPAGYQAIISAINKITLIDPYFVVRFLGPIEGFLLVLSIYYFMIKNFKSYYAALVSILIYGIVNDPGFPSAVWRQMTALSQEYATIFLLPGIHFFNLFMRDRSSRCLYLSGTCLALSLLIHPHVSLFMGLSFAAVAFCYPARIFEIRSFMGKTLPVLLISFVAGLLPVIVGLLSGKKLYTAQTVGNIRKVAGFDADVSFAGVFSISEITENNPFIIVFLLCSLLMLGFGIYWLLRGKDRNPGRLFVLVTVSALAVFVMFRSDFLGLPVIIDKYRTGIFLSIYAVVIYGGVLSIADIFLNGRRAADYVIRGYFILALCFILLFTTIKLPQGFRFEYDEAANGYLKIKNDFPALNWTIVSPVEQYQEVLGYGWHYDLYEFVQKMSSDRKEDKDFKIPTDYVFIYVEKVPLVATQVAELENLKKGVTELYYRNPENRRELESRIYSWAENYMARNKNMEVFYDGEYLRIYLIRQDGKHPVSLFT